MKEGNSLECNEFCGHCYFLFPLTVISTFALNCEVTVSIGML